MRAYIVRNLTKRRLTINKEYVEGKLHRLLAMAFQMHRKRVEPDLAEIGVSLGQPRILYYLSEHDGCIQKDLSDTFDLEPATVSVILSNMESSGLVRRESSADDRRVLRIFLTKKGAQTKTHIERLFIETEREGFRGFSETEKRKTLEYLDRVYENLKDSARFTAT